MNELDSQNILEEPTYVGSFSDTNKSKITLHYITLHFPYYRIAAFPKLLMEDYKFAEVNDLGKLQTLEYDESNSKTDPVYMSILSTSIWSM